MAVPDTLNRLYLFMLILILSASCTELHDSFKSKELTSTRGEKIYINTLNWGVTDDNQYTVISKHADELKERKDTINGEKGLTPFVYKFNSDTLYIYSPNNIKFRIKEKIETIALKYITVDNPEYMELMSKALTGEADLHIVPE